MAQNQSHIQKMRRNLCPLFLCPVSTDDVLVDGERVWGPALSIYISLLETRQWNSKQNIIQNAHCAKAKLVRDHAWKDVAPIVLKDIPSYDTVALLKNESYKAPKQIFWMRYMEVLLSQIQMCLRLDQISYPDPSVALSNLLRVFLSGIHFFLTTNPTEALIYVITCRELADSILSQSDEDFFTYNPLYVTAFSVWISDLGLVINKNLILDDKITNIDYVFGKVEWQPLILVRMEDAFDAESAREYVRAYRTGSPLVHSPYPNLDIDLGPSLDGAWFNAIRAMEWGGVPVDTLTASMETDDEAEADALTDANAAPTLQMFE